MADTIVLPNLAGLATVDSGAMNPVPSACVLDTAAGVGASAGVSYSALWPSAFQVDPVPGGTVVQVQWRIHKDAAWVVLWDSSVAANGAAGFVMTWNTPPNFVRAVRISGSGAVKAFMTVFSTDTQG